jgi:hypothetical protein
VETSPGDSRLADLKQTFQLKTYRPNLSFTGKTNAVKSIAIDLQFKAKHEENVITKAKVLYVLYVHN